MQKLTLANQKLFKQYLNLSGSRLAAFSFANIYIWSCLYDIRWQIIENSLCIFFQDKIGIFMYLPALAKERQPKVIKEAFMLMDKVNKNKEISRIENIPKDELDYYQALGYLAHEKYPDYLCLRKDLAALSGNKFKSQRASYNYFIKHYNSSCHKLKLEDRQACLSLFDSWANQRKGSSTDEIYSGMIDDNKKVLEFALDNYKELGFRGIIIKIDDEIKGFSFGYKINEDTFCILYEITDLSIKGLAQFIFRQFSQELKNYKYINIMDDSGLENLRKTKLSYKPAQLVPAYIITRDA